MPEGEEASLVKNPNGPTGPLNCVGQCVAMQILGTGRFGDCSPSPKCLHVPRHGVAINVA